MPGVSTLVVSPAGCYLASAGVCVMAPLAGPAKPISPVLPGVVWQCLYCASYSWLSSCSCIRLPLLPRQALVTRWPLSWSSSLASLACSVFVFTVPPLCSAVAFLDFYLASLCPAGGIRSSVGYSMSGLAGVLLGR